MSFKDRIFYNKCSLVVYLMLLICFYILLSCKRIPEISNATINYSYNSIGLITVSLEHGKFLLIDTGSDGSLIFGDKIKINSTIKGISLINKKHLFYHRRIDSLQIGNLLIKNHNFIFAKGENPILKKDTTIVGILGMDILSQKYCYFDIKNQTITFSDKKTTQTILPSFVFSYKLADQPISDININGNIIENVLFDTGFDSFLELLEKDKEKLNLLDSLKKEDRHGIFSNQRIVYFGEPDSIKINEVVFYNPKILYGQKYRALGMSFVKSWSSFLIDPFNKRIEFYL